jgi:hypothetical protein
MELGIIATSIIALGLLAQRFGADSRDGMRTSESDFSGLGMSWDGPPARSQPIALMPQSVTAEWVMGENGLQLAWRLEATVPATPIITLPVEVPSLPKAA